MSKPTAKHDAATPPAAPIIDRLKASGNWNPNWDPFADLDPEWTEKFMDMGLTPLRRGVLDPKVVEFLAIAVDASCTHMYAPGDFPEDIAVSWDDQVQKAVDCYNAGASVLHIHVRDPQTGKISIPPPIRCSSLPRPSSSTSASAGSLHRRCSSLCDAGQARARPRRPARAQPL